MEVHDQAWPRQENQRRISDEQLCQSAWSDPKEHASYGVVEENVVRKREGGSIRTRAWRRRPLHQDMCVQQVRQSWARGGIVRNPVPINSERAIPYHPCHRALQNGLARM
jgi:hypothetical protein